MSDILDQMYVTAANGEKVLFFNLIALAAQDGCREEYEARRFENLMQLGVNGFETGPMHVTAVAVSVTGDDRHE